MHAAPRGSMASPAPDPASMGIKRSEPFCGALAGTPRFSLRVEYGGMLFLSGLADDRQLQAEHPNDYGAQARLVLRRLDEQLAAAGIDKRRLLKVVVYLRDVELGVTAFNEAWDEWKDPNHLPARTTVEARLIRPDMLIEVDATAALPPRAP